jgi:hypothetical protein
MSSDIATSRIYYEFNTSSMEDRFEAFKDTEYKQIKLLLKKASHCVN